MVTSIIYLCIFCVYYVSMERRGESMDVILCFLSVSCNFWLVWQYVQVFSLSLEGNLKPKYIYLINELRNEVQILAKYPMYLSLSLNQRIRPRHRFLVSLKKAPRGPFPLSSFVPSDESFCQQWAGTTVDKYLAFRQDLLLRQIAKKHERKWWHIHIKFVRSLSIWVLEEQNGLSDNLSNYVFIFLKS